MSDEFYSTINNKSEEIKSKEQTCEETGVTFIVSERVDTPSGRRGNIDGFRKIRNVVFADVKLMLHSAGIMRCYALNELEKVDE